MKYIIDNDEIFTTSEDAAQYIIDNLDETYFEEMLDECYDEVEICGYKYSPSYALREIDPVAYRCSMADYYDSVWSDIKYDLNRWSDGDSGDFYGFYVEAVEDAEDEQEEEEE